MAQNKELIIECETVSMPVLPCSRCEISAIVVLPGTTDARLQHYLAGRGWRVSSRGNLVCNSCKSLLGDTPIRAYTDIKTRPPKA